MSPSYWYLLEKKFLKTFDKFRSFKNRLLRPWYLFPVKLITFSAYYIITFTLRTSFKMLIWPFRRWGNFFKTILGAIFALYVYFTLVVIWDYIGKNYGDINKFFCVGTKEKLKNGVVRVVGGYGEGSGFFIAADQVVTSFHVIADEPSPKIIFANGTFTTPEKMIGYKDLDVAVLYVKEIHPEKMLTLMTPIVIYEDEPLLAAGYALGTDLIGDLTIQNGNFAAFRDEDYIQTDINLVEGMSGGPLTDKCGKVVGVNTAGLAGLSIFVGANTITKYWDQFSDADVKKITVDTSTPEGAVEAFYIFLKARKMQDGFDLLSEAYLQKTDFEEWTSRFKDVLDVEVYTTKLEDVRRNIVFVKFSTKNWVDEEIKEHFYEGTWQTVLEDGVYKMYRSSIKEVNEPSFDWFYTDES